MELRDKVVVVTGGASGIGAALCRRFASEGAQGIVVADIDEEAAIHVAEEVGGLPITVDVGIEEEIITLVERATSQYGTIDLFCSNAGVYTSGGLEAPDKNWQRDWQVNVMSHVYAARAVLPGMLKQGDGYLLQTTSAAGLLTHVGSAPYSVTKHAATGFAEWLSVKYGNRGIKVSCICPMGVRTPMICDKSEVDNTNSFLIEDSISVEDVAEATVEGIRTERFLILPHPEVHTFFQNKADSHDSWINAMRHFQEKVMPVSLL
jgi:NAD(P)-dependent dehydrogenase (short-subunit alcohol dehydrogenase family)